MSRAVIYERFVGADVLEVREVPEPHAGDGDVRVRVRAAGLNPMDWKIASMPELAARFGGRQVIGVGFAVTTAGFAIVGFVQPSWRYLAFLLPLIAIAVGMGMSNGPASSAATASVSAEQVGSASGVSNMARYVGAAVATALAATIYATVTANRTAIAIRGNRKAR